MEWMKHWELSIVVGKDLEDFDADVVREVREKKSSGRTSTRSIFPLLKTCFRFCLPPSSNSCAI
ncbi:MAG: hypothetical protein V1977_01415 [Candidatus Diapherotrites archaeon]